MTFSTGRSRLFFSFIAAPLRVTYAIWFILLFLARPACAQVAPGVQQSAGKLATITGSVIQGDGTPVGGASVRLSGPAIVATRTDTHGTFYVTSVPYGVYSVVVVSQALGTVMRSNITVVSDIALTIRYIPKSPSPLKTIADITTRSLGARINVTPASITAVNPSEYAYEGNSSWQQLLNEVPGVVVGGYLSGGLSSYADTAGSPITPLTLSINGALPYETSVTLDGLPVFNTSSGSAGAPGAGSDLSAFPMQMFDTADVVRGPGADAPSIVDSIGGSFVLHSPARVDQNHYDFSISNDPYGGVLLNARIALRYGRLSTTVSYGANNSPGPLGRQTVTNAFPVAPLTVNGQPFSCSNPAGCVGFPENLGSNKYQSCFCAIESSLAYSGVPVDTTWHTHSGAISLTYQAGPSISAQIFYAGANTQTIGTGPYFQMNFTPSAGYSGNIKPGVHYFLQAGSPFPTGQSSSLLEERVTAYASRSVFRVAALQTNSFQRSSTDGFVPNGQYKLFGTGFYGSPPSGHLTIFNGELGSLTFPAETLSEIFWVNNRDLLFSYGDQISPAASIGISYLTSYYNDPDSIESALGPPYNLVSKTSRPPSVSETTNELRLSAQADISRRVSLSASWYFALGAYHVQNPADVTGNTYADSVFRYNAPRVGLIWRSNPNTSIRMSAGGGFALPPLYYLIGTNSIFCTTSCSATIVNLKLKPEESFSFDVGADLRFGRSTVFSADLYRTNLYGQFFQATKATGLNSGLPVFTNMYGNLSQSRYEGINVEARHDVAAGTFWNAGIGLTRAFVVNVPQGFYNAGGPFGGGPNSVNTYIVPGINFDGQYQTTVPYTMATAELGYRWPAGILFSLSPTYYGKNNSYFEPGFVELDAHAGYAITKNFSLLGTFRNLTGVYSDSIQRLTPTLGAPTIVGQPFALFGIPYGPRSFVLTANLKG